MISSLKYTVRVPWLSLPGCDHQAIFSCKSTFFFFLFWEVIKITILPSLSNSQSDFSLLLSNSSHFSFTGLPRALAFAGLTYLIRITNADDFYRELSLICFETFIYSIWHLKWLNYFWCWNEVAWTRYEFSKNKNKKPRSRLAENILCKRNEHTTEGSGQETRQITKIVWLKLNLQHKSPQSQARTCLVPHRSGHYGLPPESARPAPCCSTVVWLTLAVMSREWGGGLASGLVQPVKRLPSWTGSGQSGVQT